MCLALFEWLLSWSVASSPLVDQKGFVSDVLAAMVMVVIGGAFEMVGNHIAWQCRIPMQLIGTDMTGCVNYGESVMSFGEMVKTTLGMNSVLAAVLFYFLVTYAPRLAFSLVNLLREK
jgi:large-conductance mechanosensitive channel